MKLKILSCAMLGLLLSACNDSNDQANRAAVGEKISEYYSFDFTTPSLEEYEGDTEHLVDYSYQYRLVNGILYVMDNPHLTTRYPMAEEDIEQRTYITNTGIFEQDHAPVTNLGFKDRVVLEQTADRWVTRPVTLPESDIRQVYKLKWYDLSGQKMTTRTNISMQKVLADDSLKHVLDPANATLTVRKNFNQYAQNFLKLQQERTFPKGAQCFQFESTTPEVDYITFTTDDESSQLSLDAWQKNILDEGYAKSMEDGQIYHFKYKKAEYSDEEPSFVRYLGAIEYQNKIMNVEFSEPLVYKDSEERFYKRVLELIEKYEQDTSKEQLKLFTYNRQGSASIEGCNGYNLLAAQAIEQALKDAQVN